MRGEGVSNKHCLLSFFALLLLLVLLVIVSLSDICSLKGQAYGWRHCVLQTYFLFLNTHGAQNTFWVHTRPQYSFHLSMFAHLSL